jgi:hypothetical protein
MTSTRRFFARPLLIFFIWFAVALGIGASGRLSSLRPPAPQLVIGALTLALVCGYLLGASFRPWTVQLDLRALVALHLTRFVGFYFLALAGRGELPRDFAVPAGLGDISVAALALLLLLIRPQDRRFYFAWNTLGLCDIIFVVLTAARLALRDPASMQSLLRLPLSLLPTFLVPLIIASHLLIFVRLGDLSHSRSSSHS